MTVQSRKFDELHGSAARRAEPHDVPVLSGSPVHGLQERLLHTVPGMPQNRKWPRPVRLLLPIVLSALLWGAIVYWLF